MQLLLHRRILTIYKRKYYGFLYSKAAPIRTIPIQTEQDTRLPKMAKKKLFDEADSDNASSSGEAVQTVDQGAELQINEEYARRFEHNKKREERHRRMFRSIEPETCALLIVYSRGEI